ncbi:hypothetical protein HMPREF1214_04160 [Bacteroides sp. HPS0048]|uniref:hypothetical protein n=1 Tax=Bacteroides sp. HPS0048 TaxID=1078089 RepID=UPI000375B4D0|nr:hypothetical protein [Bacteroides sp. HPS0048]EOA54334.1 hypothetical protein HMPREF1214_04160 [Bacteroides sp. HPS0048]
MSKLPYLFYVDTQSVNTIYQNQSKLFPLYSELYKEAKKLGLDFSLAQLNDLMSKYAGVDKESILTELVKNNLISKMGNVEFGGVAIRKEALANMIIIPNLDNLKTIMQRIHSVDFYRFRMDIELANISDNGDITLKNDAKDILTRKNSVYADTENQAAFYEKAQLCAEAMNTFANFSKNKFEDVYPIKGICFNDRNGKYIPDVHYIKQYIK